MDLPGRRAFRTLWGTVSFGVFFHFLCLWVVLAVVRVRGAESPVILVGRSAGGGIELRWDGGMGAGYILEATDNLDGGGDWLPLGLEPVQQGGYRVISVLPEGGARYLRLRGAGLVSLAASSPRSGESGVSVTRETSIEFTEALEEGVVLGVDDFYAVHGGRRVLGRVELWADRRGATLFYLERLPASARVRVFVDGGGLVAEGGRGVDLDGDGLEGGVVAFDYYTSATSALEGTGVVGWVYASELGEDGSNRPLAGVTVTVDGEEERLRAVTDEAGFFRL